jgi:hypothetical protein
MKRDFLSYLQVLQIIIIMYESTTEGVKPLTLTLQISNTVQHSCMHTACAVKSGLQELSFVIYLSEHKGK